MSQDEDKTNALFDNLIKKTSSKGSVQHSGAEVLRDALRAQIETTRAAKHASRDDLTPEELSKMDALKLQLLKKGLIGTAPDSNKKSIQPENRTSLLQRFFEIIFDVGWQRSFALTASVIFAVVIVFQVSYSPDRDSEIIIRGSESPVIVSADPKTTTETISNQLRKAGAVVLAVQINAFEWTLRIDVPSSANKSTIQKILLDKGIKIEGAPPYKLSIKNKR